MIILKSEEIANRNLDAATLSQAKTLFETDGFLKIENLFEKELIQLLASDLMENLSIENDALTRGTRIHNRRYIVSVALKPPFNQPELYANSILLSLMKEFLGPHYILGSIGAVISLPGAPDQHIHSDYEPLFKEQPELRGVLPPYAITVGIPLIDIDLLNGPTKIWAGSHRVPSPDAKNFPRHLLCGPVGSCYFWDYRTLHAGGSNHSEQMRPLLYLAYTRRWFKDYLNPDLLLIEEEIPEEHRHLFPIQQLKYAEAETDFKAKVSALFGPA